MNLYRKIQLALRANPRLSLAGLCLMHTLHRRYLTVNVDPIMACNYRCLMCHRSSDAHTMSRDVMTPERAERIATALFDDAMHVQIGCAMEPTLRLDLTLQLIGLARQHGVPHISMCTNGALLSLDDIRRLHAAGLDELIISCHGVERQTYEHFMGGKYDRFLLLLDHLHTLQHEGRCPRVRINYTMNADNTAQLAAFWQVFAPLHIDTLQLRPAQDIGSTEYRNYDMAPVLALMDSVVQPLIDECHRRGTTVLAPDRRHLAQLGERKVETSTVQQRLGEMALCYASPLTCLNDEYDLEHETYRQYCHRTRRIGQMLSAACRRDARQKEAIHTATKAMNYEVK